MAEETTTQAGETSQASAGDASAAAAASAAATAESESKAAATEQQQPKAQTQQQPTAKAAATGQPTRAQAQGLTKDHQAAVDRWNGAVKSYEISEGRHGSDVVQKEAFKVLVDLAADGAPPQFVAFTKKAAAWMEKRYPAAE